MERKISLLVPLSRFKVKYEVKVGRPCSELDEFVLRAIAEGSSSMSELEDKFQLPSRLMIEILVTLFTEGWISIIRERSGGFALTRQGQSILNSGKLLEIRRGRVREGAVMMERLTGALIAQKDIVFDSEPQLKRDHHWEKAFRLQATFDENRLDEGQVQYFLRRGKQEWIRNISPPVLVSSYYWWLPVGVEVGREAVMGLPERWASRLKPLLLEEAEKILRQHTDITFTSYWGDGSSLPRGRGETDEAWPTSILRSDLLSKRSEHIACLRQVLATARTTLLIASTFIDIHNLGAEVRGWMLEALRRGVEIDILWGDTKEQDKRARGAAIAWLEGIADEAKESNAKGGLRFNKEPSNSNLRLLMYDSEEMRDGSQQPAAPPDAVPQKMSYRALIGSFNWLGESMKTGGAPVEPAEHFTVCIGQSEIIGRLSRSVAAIMNAQRSDHFSLTADRWNNIAEELQSGMMDAPSEAQAAAAAAAVENNPLHCTIRLVSDYEHQALFKSSLLSAQMRCAVFSSKIGAVALARLAPLNQRKQTPAPLLLTVRYGELRDMTAEQQTAFRQLIDAAAGQFTRQDGLQANALLADQTVLVSSYQFLAESPFARASHTKALGILIEGGIAADILAEEYGLQTQQK